MKKYILIIAIILAASVSSCKKDFLSLEVNPNEPSVTTPQLTLAGALAYVPNIEVNDYVIYDIWSGYWSWNGGVVPPASIFQYQFTNTDFSPTIWTDLYFNATNFNNLIKATSGTPALHNFQAIGMIMKAWDFENLVDNFNDVPYSQAFQPSTILFPKYDKAADIYTDLGKQLDAAIALIASSGGATSPGPSDVMFGGDMTKWSQFAETLKLRLAVTASNVTAVESAVGTGLPAAGNSYLTTDALINPGYANTAGQINPFYGGFVFDANGNPGANAQVFRANAYSINLLKNSSDPRLGQEFSIVQTPLPASGNYRGNVFGDAINILGTQFTSGAGPAYSKGPTQSSILMLASESYFLQAEAVARGYITGDAAALYASGITSDFEYLGLTDAQAATFIAANPYPTGAPVGTQVKAIIYQKYVTLLNGYDALIAYNDYRRTGYPALPSSVDPAALSSHLPSRIFYPLSEAQSNPTQYAAAGAASISQFTSQIFWDTRTGL
jgi:hypothetical protein